MKDISFLIPISLLLWLCSCSKTSYELSSDTALQQLKAIEETLPTECKTDSVISQINATKTSIESIESSCKAEIKNGRYSKYIAWIISIVLLYLLIRRK